VAPEVKKVAEDMAGRAIVLKVDTEQNPELAARFNVRGIPNFVVLSKGRVVKNESGAVDHRQLRRWIESAAT
jgi:thioredoxin 2